MRRWHAATVLGLVTLPFACASAPTSSESRASGSSAQEVLVRVRERFALTLASESLRPDTHAGAIGGDPSAAGLYAELPRSAGGWARIVDNASRLEVRYRALDETPSPISFADGVGMYLGAAPGGGDVLQTAGRDSVEDFTVIYHPPELERLRYELDVSGIPGLRWVGGSLELLDAGGTPRLRVSPPYVVDATGRAQKASLELFGCEASRDPQGPWGRPVVAAGADRCSLNVVWSRVSYPIAVDPTWTSTALMAETRGRHTAALLSDGRVLVSGGVDGVELATAELFDPKTSTWAATGSMAEARQAHTLTRLTNGRVLAVGGKLGTGHLSSAEIYDPSTGAWSSAPSMSTPRSRHAAVLLKSGGALVIGGDGGASDVSKSVEVFDPTSAGWSPRTSAAWIHHDPAVLLDDGRVFVAGTYAELYDPNDDSWTETAYINHTRLGYAMAKLSDGRVVLAGDLSDPEQTTADLYDPVKDSWQTVPLQQPRYQSVAAPRSDGGILLTGGTNLVLSPTFATAERFDPAAGTWTSTDDMTSSRYAHTSTTLADGRVLIAGGISVKGVSVQTLRSAEVFQPLGGGEACTSCADCASQMCQSGACIDTPAPVGQACSCNTGCASGFCVDGVCCDAACDGVCEACSASKTSEGNGHCAPVTTNSDPDDECHADPTSPGACADDPVCNGAGACYCAPAGAGQCVNDHTLVANGKATDCSPYKCEVSGVCRTSCSNSNDCIAGTVCDQGQCAAPAAAANDDGGCGCLFIGRRGRRTPWVGAIALLWLAARRRRRRAR